MPSETKGIYFLVCNELIIRTDVGSNMTQGDYKIISSKGCRSINRGEGCINRGICIEARVSETWKRPNKKTHEDKV